MKKEKKCEIAEEELWVDKLRGYVYEHTFSSLCLNFL